MSEYLNPTLRTHMLAAYNGSDRHYHNMTHINFMLAQLNKLALSPAIWNDNVVRNSHMIKLIEHAIWWHDYVYNPFASKHENEFQSADAFLAASMGGLIRPLPQWTDTEVIVNAIRATSKHSETQENLSDVARYLLDIDLASFALPLRVVEDHGEAIVREYAPLGLPRSVIMTNRRAFLQKLLDRGDSLFYTDYFRDLYLADARQNVQQVISGLFYEIG